MARYTQRLIMSTFEQMLAEMPFDKITVSALVKRCDISPNTFYYHYQDIYALLNAFLESRFGQYTQCDYLAEKGWRTATKEMLADCKRSEKLIYHIYNSLSRDVLERYVFTITDDVFYRQVKRAAAEQHSAATDARLHEIAGICRYAFLGFFLKFLWNRMDDDIDKSVDSLGELFAGFVENVVKTHRKDTAGLNL